MSIVAVLPFSIRCQAGFNAQISAEMQAFYQYRAISYYFSRHDVAFKNVAAKFYAMAQEELEHADVLSRYLQSRGGIITHAVLQAPEAIEMKSLIQAFEYALGMEKSIHVQLRALDQMATDENEPHCAAFLQDTFLTEQITAEDELMRVIATLKRMGPGLGEQLFDQGLAVR